LSNASQHVPIYLQPFPSNSSRALKVRHFSTFLHIFASPVYASGTKCHTVGKRIQCWSNASQHVGYPSIFNLSRAIARYWSEIETFSYILAFNAPVEGVTIGIPGKILVYIKLESWGYTRPWREFDDRLSRFDTIPACDGRTDRRMDGLTDVQPITITCFSIADARKNILKHSTKFVVQFYVALLVSRTIQTMTNYPTCGYATRWRRLWAAMNGGRSKM